IAAGVLAVLVMAEQWRSQPPSFAHGPFFAEVEGLRERLEAAGGPAYVPLAPGRPFWQSQLVAMWAGLRANVPVVNGYSGRYPPGYPDWEHTAPPDRLAVWLGSERAGRCRYVTTEEPGGLRPPLATASESACLSSPLKPW